MTTNSLFKGYAAGKQDFHNTDLNQANLIVANLSGANLKADLRGAKLYGADRRSLKGSQWENWGSPPLMGAKL